MKNSNLTNCHETLADSMKDLSAAFNKVIQSDNPHKTKEQKASHKVKTDVQLAKYIYSRVRVCHYVVFGIHLAKGAT